MSRAFRQIPPKLDDDPSIPPGAKRLWRVLDQQARQCEWLEAGGPALCSLLSCSPSALRLWRQALVTHGWLEHVASAGGPRQPSLWRLLQRPRAGVRPGLAALDHRGRRVVLTRHESGGSDQVNPADLWRVSTGPYKDRAGEEARSGHAVAWCRTCSQGGRLVYPPDGGDPFPCPTCHPQRTKEPMF